LVVGIAAPNGIFRGCFNDFGLVPEVDFVHTVLVFQYGGRSHAPNCANSGYRCAHIGCGHNILSRT
jgi:hypothetical protein